MAKRILVALDRTRRSKEALTYAGDVAVKNKATVYVVHVIPRTGLFEEVFEPLILRCLRNEGVRTSSPDEKRQKAAHDLLKAARWELRMRGIKDVRPLLLQGEPVEEITHFAERNHIDVIVLAGRPAGPLKKRLIQGRFGRTSTSACYTCMTAG